jgi:TRAP-type uncharacterized transport system substrate-binding protein
MSVRNAIRWLQGQIAYSVGFGFVILLLIGIGLLYWGRSGAHKVHLVRIAYGAGAPVRKRLLDQMAVHGKKWDLDIRLVATGGTDQTLSLIDRNDADLGLIASVVEDRGSRKVLEIVPLYMEPLQLLVREELYEAILKDFGQLRGKSIDVDNPSSATHLLASELLRFMGLTDAVTGQPQYRPVDIPELKLANGTSDQLLPDAIFQVGGVPSASIRHLIVNRHYRLVPLPFGAPFNLDTFRDTESPQPAVSAKLRLNKAFVEEAVVPAFVYSVLPPVPPDDIRTIATRLLLVGSERVDSQIVRQILDLVLSPEISSFARPALTVELLNTNFQFERHPGTDTYLNALKPVDVESAFVAYARLGEVWGLIIALYVGAAKGLKAWQGRRMPEQRTVGDFIDDVLAVEAEAGASCSAADRIALDQRLTDIKKASLDLHRDGRLQDAEELPSLLVTLADARTRIWGAVHLVG